MTSLTRVTLEADSRQIRKAANDVRDLGNRGQVAGRQVDRFGRETNRATNQTRQLSTAARTLTRVLGALGIGLSIRALQQFASNTINAADELSKMSRQLGITANELQALGFAASQSGVSQQALESSLARLNRRVGEARQGTGELSKLVDELGISTVSTEAAFNDIADAIQNSSDEADAGRIAMQAFGREGLVLVRILQNGSGGLNDFRQQAAEMGLIIDDSLLPASERFNDSMDVFQRRIRVAFSESFLRGVSENIDLIENSLDSLADTMLNNTRLFQALGLAASALVAIKLAKFAIAAATGFRGLAGVLALMTGPGAAIFVLAGVLGTIANEMDKSRRATDEFAQSLENLTLAKLENELQRLQERRRELISERDQLDIFSQPSPEAANELRIIGQQTKEIQKAIEQYKSSTDDATESTKELSVALGISVEEAQDLGKAFAASLPAIDKLPPSVRDLNNAVSMTGVAVKNSGDAANESMKSLADTINRDVGNGLTDLIMQAKSAEDVFVSLANQISRTLIQQQIADPLAQGITRFATNAFGGIFGGEGLDQNANGGNVFGGVPSIVGERGPEVFVPRQDGQIVPNHQMGEGGNVTVNVINQGGDQLEAQQKQTRRGPNGDTIVDVMVKKSIDRLDSQGQLDGIFNRHGARRQGQF